MDEPQVNGEPQPATGPTATTRRTLFVGAGAVGAVAALAACGDDGGDGGGGDDQSPPDGGGDGAGESGQPLATTGQVEVGGGLINTDRQVVVTQPTEGTFRGFSAVCTHQGCIVAEVADGTINCDCHGSRYAIEDGSVVAAANNGDPAQQDPLPEVEVDVDGDEIVRA